MDESIKTTVSLPRDLHRQFKTAAIARDVKVAAAFEDAMRLWIVQAGPVDQDAPTPPPTDIEKSAILTHTEAELASMHISEAELDEVRRLIQILRSGPDLAIQTVQSALHAFTSPAEGSKPSKSKRRSGDETGGPGRSKVAS